MSTEFAKIMFNEAITKRNANWIKDFSLVSQQVKEL